MNRVNSGVGNNREDNHKSSAEGSNKKNKSGEPSLINLSKILSRENRLILLERMYETFPHPVYFKNREGIIMGANNHFAEGLLGLKVDEVTGKKLSDFKNIDFTDSLERIYKADHDVLDTGIPQNYQITVKIFNGERKDFKVYKASFKNTEGETEGLVCVLMDITEQISLAEKASKNEEKLSDILENLQEVYFESSLEGVLLDISPSINKISGYSSREVIGKPLHNFYANIEDRAIFLEKLSQSGIIKDHELLLIDKNGNFRQALVNSKLLYNEKEEPIKIIGSIKDLTSTYRYREALNESEAKYKILLENAGAHIMYTDPSGKVILINKNAAGFLGKNPEEIKGKNILKVFRKDYAAELLTQINNIIKNKKGAIREICVPENGEKFWFLTNFQPVIDKDDQVKGIVIISNDITDRKHSEQEMFKLSQAIEQSTAMIMITNTGGKIEYINQRYTDVTGYNFRDLHGKQAGILNKTGKSPEEYALLKSAMKEGRVHEGEYRNRKKNGEEYWVKVILSPVFDEENKISNYIIVKEDVTESHKAKERERIIRENLIILNETAIKILKVNPNQNIYHLLGEQLKILLPDCIFSINSYNPESNKLKSEYLYSKNDILKKFINLASYPKNPEMDASPELINTLRSGNMSILEKGFFRLMMGKVPEKLCSQMEKSLNIQICYHRGITNNNVLYGSICIIPINKNIDPDRDLIDNFILQASLGIERIKLEDELLQAKETAEEMNRIKTVFLANMSHELRTPLNGILGFSELLAEQINDPGHREMLRAIHRSGLRLLDTLNIILDFSTLEARKIEFTWSQENVVELLEKVVEDHREEAEKKSLTLSLIPATGKLYGYVVSGILQKIVHNLLSNAIKFTNKGKVSLTVKEKFSKKQRYLIISVQDTGIGIPADELDQIFREFRQGSEGFTRKYEGTGLGLTISKKFTDMLGGEIFVKSNPGKGSEFTLQVPLYAYNPIEHN